MEQQQQEEEEEEEAKEEGEDDQHEASCPCRQWKKKKKKKDSITESMDATLTRYWAREVPPLLSPRADCDCLNVTYDEARVKARLLDPLEHLVSLDTMSAAAAAGGGQSAGLCGRMFRPGEATYCCRDCATDPTCVLCVECFQASGHRAHRYRMSMSGGGGYCDCGDTEAWTKGPGPPGCDLHPAANLESSGQTSASGVEQEEEEKLELEKRLEEMVRALVRYCHLALTWESGMNLPAQLEPTDQRAACYATVLFNDEVHTYEQVIATLARAVECTQKEAVDYATAIDREGRAMVKCSASFQVCSSVKATIEKITGRNQGRPLRTQVMLTAVLAHQNFAGRVLTWIQDRLLPACPALARAVLGRVMTAETYNSDTCSLLEQVMRADAALWKTARSQWHRLFVAGLLMDPGSKRTFARTFTRAYPALCRDFVADDHDVHVSVMSLTVQVFTVPSLGLDLLTGPGPGQPGALFILLNTFLDECRKFVNPASGKLQLERVVTTTVAFRRAQYILVDLKYLLANCKPRGMPGSNSAAEWTAQLRSSFCHGFEVLVTLLDWIQGMDSVTRQVGSHVEFESEWENGINLQLKLTPVLALMIEWAASDATVLSKCLALCLKKLKLTTQAGVDGAETTSRKKILGSAAAAADVIDYDVSSCPVSVHAPLSRTTVALLVAAASSHAPSGSYSPAVDMVQLMEPSLRSLVLAAQFRAGMWRRNGYSLVNQVYFYHNARLREEMFDRDILALQAAAARLGADEFLVHAANKFGLLALLLSSTDPTDSTTTDVTRQTTTCTLMEEFLSLVLTLVSERWSPGLAAALTPADRVRKEVVQCLAVEPATRSELLKAIADRAGADEAAIESVAEFRAGKYHVRGPVDQWFNPFFYHYSREQSSRAEAAQLKNKIGYRCCAPPLPPRFAEPFRKVLALVTSDTSVLIFGAVLKARERATFSEVQLEKVLHLIGLGLREEERFIQEERQMEEEEEQLLFDFSRKCVERGIVDSLKNVRRAPITSDHVSELLRWTLDTFSRVLRLRGLYATTSQEEEEEEKSVPKEEQQQGKNEEIKDSAALAAKKRRERILAQIQSQQKSFMSKNPAFFPPSNQEKEEEEEGGGSKMEEQEEPKNDQSESHTCILCREEQEVSLAARALVLCAFVQRSTVLSKDRKSTDSQQAAEALFMPADLSVGAHVSTCGHVMHADCWQSFFEGVLAKERRRPLRYGRHVSFDVDKAEFLCPLCACLSNTVIPVLPPPPAKSLSRSQSFSLSLDDWIKCLFASVDQARPVWVRDPSMSVETGEKYICRFESTPADKLRSEYGLEARVVDTFLSGEEAPIPLLSEPVREMMRLFSQSIYTIGLNVHQNPDDDRVPVLSFWSCAFSMHALERVLRLESTTGSSSSSIFADVSSRKFMCLRALVRYVALSPALFDVAVLRTHAVKLLKYLLVPDASASSSCCVLDIDPLGLLLSLVLASPSLYAPSSSPPVGEHRHFVTLVLTLHAVQIILSRASQNKNKTEGEEEKEEEPMEVQEEEEEQEAGKESDFVTSFAANVTRAAGITSDANQISPADLKTSLVPFLRCAALFVHFLLLTGSESESTTTKKKKKEEESDSEHEFSLLVRFLGFADPSLNALMGESADLRNLALNWARNPRVHAMISSQGICVIGQPHEVNQLVPLPADYSDLVNAVSAFSCQPARDPPGPGSESGSPTMCLVCGSTLCSQSYCCQSELEPGTLVGACTLHAHRCGSGTGVFLRIRDCKILLLAGRSKGCFLSAPFVDDFGETDPGLARGNPLKLSERAYSDLHRLWLRHGIPEQVAHALESSPNLSGTNWPLL